MRTDKIIYQVIEVEMGRDVRGHATRDLASAIAMCNELRHERKRYRLEAYYGS